MVSATTSSHQLYVSESSKCKCRQGQTGTFWHDSTMPHPWALAGTNDIMRKFVCMQYMSYSRVHINRNIMSVLRSTDCAHISSVPSPPYLCNTSTDGSDYEGGNFSVTFPAGVNVASFNVTIINDAIAECAKLFTLDLEIPAAAAAMGVIRGSPDTATVHIMDDDGERTLACDLQYLYQCTLITLNYPFFYRCSWRAPSFLGNCWLLGEGECRVFRGCSWGISSSRFPIHSHNCHCRWHCRW